MKKLFVMVGLVIMCWLPAIAQAQHSGHTGGNSSSGGFSGGHGGSGVGQNCPPVQCAPVHCAPVHCAPVRCEPARCAPVRCEPARSERHTEGRPECRAEGRSERWAPRGYRCEGGLWVSGVWVAPYYVYVGEDYYPAPTYSPAPGYYSAPAVVAAQPAGRLEWRQFTDQYGFVEVRQVWVQ